ncbi:MAG: TIGR00730 family Rossman fold protein [Bacteroidales bacterium]|nr:TIGR00730 family Rossman fold protein [Bacteroidales bacterium]MCB8998569.1 TIGR00730 family Rossman fold protein [Bacteroidales bacterium]MCB9012563.1 TIGR00730 family Rossman fold protein [Bacteroidales bacterium]
MNPVRKVCVFCASSPKINSVYFRDAEILGKLFLEHNIHVSYGGGSQGLMGTLADTMIAGGGKITGIIPGFMKKMNWAHPAVTDMIEVETMHQRKNLMIKGVDAVIALPGGVGTLEELTELITLKQLGQFLAPIVMLNTNDFYRPLEDFFHKMTEEKFMRPVHKDIWLMVEKPEDVIPAIKNAPPWNGDAIKYAAVED